MTRQRIEGQRSFEFRPPPRESQAAHLARVRAVLAEPVASFCRGRLLRRPEFHLAELVEAVGGGCPDSASRILRDLRARGVVDYVVVNRRASLYRVLSVNGAST